MLLDEVEENSYKLFEGLLKKEIRKYVVSQVSHRSRCNILYSTFVCRPRALYPQKQFFLLISSFRNLNILPGLCIKALNDKDSYISFILGGLLCEY